MTKKRKNALQTIVDVVTNEFDIHKEKKNRNGTPTSEFNKEIEVIIPENIYLRMVAAVKELAKEDLEVGGKMKITYDEEKNQLRISDYDFLKQKVSTTDFEIDEEETARWMLEHMDDEDFHEWRGWWHSHHNMSLFWSGTDDQMFNKLLEGEDEYKDCFGIVFTTDGNFRARYDIRTPYGVCTNDNVEVTIERQETPEEEYARIEEEMSAAIALNVKKSKPVTQVWTGGYNIYYGENYKQPKEALEIEEYLENRSQYWYMEQPGDIDSLVEMTRIHKNVFKEWDLEAECKYWGINYTKVKEELEQRKGKGLRTVFCTFCNKPTTKTTKYGEWNEELCKECWEEETEWKRRKW